MAIEGMAIVSDARQQAMIARGRYEDACDRGGYPARQAAAMKRADEAYSAAKAQYPIAAAWMLADSYSGAAHGEKASAGRRAKARIEAGEDAAIVVAEMKAAWTQAAARCVDNN